MSKVTLNPAATLEDIVKAINTNNALLVTVLDTFLSRNGTSPNAMEASLDMNSNRILNLPAPQSSKEPLRLQDAANGITFTAANISSYIQTLLDDVDAATARTTLGLGSLATKSAVATADITDANVTTAKIADGNVTTAKITDANVVNTKLGNMANGTIKGRTTAGTGAPEDLTQAQAAAILQTTGTFTPTLTFGGSSTGITYTVQSGSYWKLGNLVFVNVHITLSNKGAQVGNAIINGLPFTVGSAIMMAPMFMFAATAGVGDVALSAFFVNGTTTMSMFNNAGQLTNASFTNTTDVNISGCFLV